MKQKWIRNSKKKNELFPLFLDTLIYIFILFLEEMLIPKSINNGNDHDYVYLDTLEGDNVGKFLSFEKKCIPTDKKMKMKLLNENRKSSKYEVYQNLMVSTLIS